jgi:glycosyltransferase involved in cell wall biosynthesis
LIEKSESDIMKNWKGDFSKPIVSICSITYNHEDFIEEALDTFLMQETNFPFEIVIDDDASSDNNQNIIEKYSKAFPHIIKANLRNDNIGMINNYIKNTKRAKGKYIALCEGDDYWTDSLKIQKQCDFLENNKNYAFCFHDYDIWNETEESYHTNVSVHHINFPINAIYSSTRILLGPFVASTLTLMFKNIIDRPNCLNRLPFGDKSFEKLLAFYGDGYFINDSMACYRNHNKGISKKIKWQESMSNHEMINIELYECLQKTFPNQHIEVVNCRIDYHKIFLERNNRLGFLLNMPKELKVIRVYVKMSRDSFFDKTLLTLLLLSRWYFHSYIFKLNERIYQKIYKFLKSY